MHRGVYKLILALLGTLAVNALSRLIEVVHLNETSEQPLCLDLIR